MRIGIIDYDAGNLASFSNAIKFLGHDPVVVVKPQDFNDLIHLVLPGVGAFGHGMKQLQQTGWDIFIKNYIHNKNGYFLGICLGMQLMCDSSDEGEGCEGLKIVPGKVQKLVPIETDERVPHVGWNNVNETMKSPIMNKIPNNSDFYFVHSYALKASSMEVGSTSFCGQFTSAVQYNEMTFGAQFHPEKSSKHGSQLLKNFLGFC